MTFLNASLMFGLAAIAVPIVLHLINRREPRRVLFPSVRFLKTRFDTNRSRLRIRRWWLLALRIAALAALALALARPAIHQSLSITWITISMVAALGVALLVLASIAILRGLPRALSYGLALAALAVIVTAVGWGTYTYASGPAPSLDRAAPVAIAIVLDNSPTAAWRTTYDDRTARMKDFAAWMVARLPATSRIAILDRSTSPATFSLDAASALSKIDQIKPIEVTLPIAARIDAAARLVRTSDLTSRQVIVVTNLTKTTWNDSVAEAGLAALFAEDPAVALTVFDLGEFSTANRSLSIPSLADTTPPRGSSVPLSTTLKLDATKQASGLSVTAELQLYENDVSLPVVRDGVVRRPNLRSVDRTSVQIAAGGSSELLLTLPPLDVGMHHARVHLVGDDALAMDNQRHFSIHVLPPSAVLLVSDSPEEARIIGQTINAPFQLDDPNAEFKIERIGFEDLPVIRLADYEAVILMDPRREVLADEALMEFARRGGGVMVCLGPAAGDRVIESGNLPKLVRRWRVPDPGTFLQVTRPSHPVVAPLAEIVGGVPWSDFRVRQYWQIETAEGDLVLARYAGTEHAAVVERLIANDGGEPGRWLILTTPVPALSDQTRRWNELFSATDAWPAFLLVRQMIETLTRRGGSPLTVLVGQPHLVSIQPDDSDNVDERASARLQLFPPGNTPPIPLEVAGRSRQVVVNEVPHSGTYWLRGAGVLTGFSANLPERATELDRIDAGQLDRIFGTDGYRLAMDNDDIELAESQAAQRVSLHSPVMLLALVVFLLEQILANRFYRRQGGESVVSVRSATAA